MNLGANAREGDTSNEGDKEGVETRNADISNLNEELKILRAEMEKLKASQNQVNVVSIRSFANFVK